MDALQQFTEVVRAPGDRFSLFRAALLIAASEYPDLDMQRWTALRDEWRQEAGRRIDAGGPLSARISAFHEYFFDTLGFRGNEEDYGDPRNSFLNDVMERRTGLPITLSLLYAELASGAAIHARGVGFPSHFLVKVSEGEEELFIDPFHRGASIERKALLEALQSATAGRLGSYEAYLAGVTGRQILQRMLFNLKSVYLPREDWERALRTIDFLQALAPWDLDEVRDRGLTLARLGRDAEAADCLKRYLDYRGAASDSSRVRAALDRLEQR
jgi:regulator of sirC expression with transglutaminase-like and TPR domain